MDTNLYHTNWYKKKEQPKGHTTLQQIDLLQHKAKTQKGKREKGNPRVEAILDALYFVCRYA